MNFDIVITTFKRAKDVLRAVDSCLKQGELLRKVIVVDNGSCDGTVDMLRRIRDSRLEVVELPANVGISKGRRVGFDLSQADWTIQLDSDMELLWGALDVFAKHMREIPPGVGIVGARYRWPDGHLSPEILPEGVVGYEARIYWASLPNSIGMDYLSCISRDVRQRVRWPDRECRSIAADALYQMNLAKVTRAVYLPDVLALQYEDGAGSVSRSAAAGRFAMRMLSARDNLALFQEIIDAHGMILLKVAPKSWLLYSEQVVFTAVLASERRVALRYALSVTAIRPFSMYSWRMLVLSLIPLYVLKAAYAVRG